MREGGCQEATIFPVQAPAFIPSAAAGNCRPLADRSSHCFGGGGQRRWCGSAGGGGGGDGGCGFGDGFRGGYAPPTPSSDREGPGAMRGVGGGGGEGMLRWGGGGGGGGGTADGAATGFGGLGDGLPRPLAGAGERLARPSVAATDLNSAAADALAAAGSESVARSAPVRFSERGAPAGGGGLGGGSGSGMEWAWEAASGPGPADALRDEYWRE